MTEAKHPIGLRPPTTGLNPGAGKPAGHGMVWGALTVVVIVGLTVVLVLPKLVSENSDVTAAQIPGQSLSGSSLSTSRESADARDSAEQAMQDFLHTRARLELANAPTWGEPEWSQALEDANRGNQFFGERQYSRASQALGSALEQLLKLESETELRLDNALNSAERALQSDDSIAAIIFFETAKSIDTDNMEAIDGLQRARVRPELLKTMAEGEFALSLGDLSAARVAYTYATELDSVYEPAQSALKEVSKRINDLGFTDAMSRALSALEVEEVDLAEAALREAANLKPSDDALVDTQLKLEQLRQKLWIADQRRQAALNERNENWTGAAAIYRKVLASAPKAAFARLGLALAEDRERLHRQLDHYLSDPERIWSDQPRANAEQLIESAGSPPAAETRLAEKIDRLQGLIIDAQTPRMVVLNSDGLTSVQIYHIGRLGQFVSRQLELLPGTYTMVGSRPGYRDVRLTFTVKPGSEQTPLEIRCEEPV